MFDRVEVYEIEKLCNIALVRVLQTNTIILHAHLCITTRAHVEHAPQDGMQSDEMLGAPKQ